MKIAFFFAHDSFYKGCLPLQAAFEKKGFATELFQFVCDSTETDNDIFKKNISTFSVLKNSELELFLESASFEAFYLNLPGNHLTNFFRIFSEYFNKVNRKKRPILIGGYNGLLSYRLYEGFYARSFLDLFHVNAKKDFDLFNELLSSLDISFKPKIVLSGLPILDWSRSAELNKVEREIILFVGQPNLPKSKQERVNLLIKLNELAKRFPSKTVVIKPRVKLHEKTFHRIDFHFHSLYKDLSNQIAWEKNLVFSYEDVETLVTNSCLVISICSTVLLEASCAKVPVVSLTDFGINETIGNSFFLGSGVLMGLDSIVSESDFPAIDPVFYKDNIYVTDSSSKYVADQTETFLKNFQAKEVNKTIMMQLSYDNDLVFNISPMNNIFKKIIRGFIHSKLVSKLVNSAIYRYRKLKNL